MEEKEMSFLFDLNFTKKKAPEFPKFFDWLNTEEELSLEKLKGHVVVLDMFTYCCVNCMHALPVLAELEKKYEGKPVVFIGVHSAKFENEQLTQNIEQAVARYEIHHPVVVDEEMTIWRSYGVNAWPTLVVIDPKGEIFYKRSGEPQKEVLEDVIDTLLEESAKKDTLAKEPFEIKYKPVEITSTLAFPGKLSISKDGKIALSDSNHNRILVTDLSGKIEQIIGNGEIGFSDGDFETATFFRPQGVLWKEGDIYVADTENHALRKIDMKNRKVITLVGTGEQGPWLSEGGKGREVAITSPWDLASKDNLIFIAMAGNHQIWVYNIETEVVRRFAGSGRENIVDGENLKAQLAQPSGLSIYGNKLYFADSEVSAIREIDLAQMQVKTIVGQGLFVFGHQDGPVEQALFQHPLGVFATVNKIYVADTYNGAIRVIDLMTKQVSSLIGKPGMKTVCRVDDPDCDKLGLYEPSDVELFDNMLYITDTNNHLVRVYDLEKNILQTLDVRE
jgi:thiol-disulfide isomerase/thioredoxin